MRIKACSPCLLLFLPIAKKEVEQLHIFMPGFTRITPLITSHGGYIDLAFINLLTICKPMQINYVCLCIFLRKCMFDFELISLFISIFDIFFEFVKKINFIPTFSICINFIFGLIQRLLKNKIGTFEAFDLGRMLIFSITVNQTSVFVL